MNNRVGLPSDPIASDRRLVTRARTLRTDPATGRVVEHVELRYGRKANARDWQNDNVVHLTTSVAAINAS